MVVVLPTPFTPTTIMTVGGSAASAGGAPVSTTHVVATSIMGIGASERPRAVRWAKAKDIATTWIITIPGAALVAIQAYALLNLYLGGRP